MVDAIVSIAIEKLSDFLTQEINTRIGAKDGVQWLKDELVYLQSSARYAESRQDEELIRIWINNVNDVAYDSVNILERFGDHQKKHAAPKQGVLDCLWSSICMCKKEANLYDIGKEIESVKERVNEIKNRRTEYGIDNILNTPIVKQRKRTLLKATAFENKVDVVGFEDDVQTLLAGLTRKDPPSLNYISIHGMGGLGKTTLASKLYHSSELSDFQNRAWVCVSEEYKIKDVLRTIIKSFMKPEAGMDYLDKMDEGDLLQYLQNLLDGEKFLLVIDDIWDIKVWEKIKSAFPDKSDSSIVIITTRSKKVAERVDEKCIVHKLRFLREDESWQLFCKKAKQTPNLDKLGKEMVGRCRGLPLAIVALGGLLFYKKSYKDWSKVKSHLWRQLKGESAEIDEILSLSYNDLSTQMRDCFLYLARFPEDHIFGVEKLKLLWIAEEFITEKDGVVMEDVAEEYLNELINRNMIHIAAFEFDGQIAKCRVHDVVRDLAIQKASADKFLGIFDSSKNDRTPVRGQRRQVIYNGIGKYLNLLGCSSDDLKVCSLGFMNGCDDLEIKEMKFMCSRFENLIVLDLTSVEYSEGMPEDIGNLVRLKFLGLMAGELFSETPVAIPASIRKLKKLQTLWGSYSSTYKIPREICELEDLRHIRVPQGSHVKIHSRQTKLQTVCTIRYSDWIQIDTLNFFDLRTLSITSIEGEEESGGGNAYSLEFIANLTSLQTFSLDFSHFLVIPSIKPLSYCKNLQSVHLSGPIKDPSELKFLPEPVTNLSLLKSKFTQDPMPTLATLSNLTALELGKGTYKGKKMVCSDNTFPCLQFLKITGLSNMEEWHVEDGAMPSLRGFYIDDCNNLEIPERLKCVPPTPDITHEILMRRRTKRNIQTHIQVIRAAHLFSQIRSTC